MNATPLWNFMNERHAIYLRRKNGGAKPWTHDSILATARFCNVYRELDRTTGWIAQFLRRPHQDDPLLWFALAVARVFNLPTVLGEILRSQALPLAGRPYDPDRLLALLTARRDAGHPRYAAAYMIWAGNSAEWKTRVAGRPPGTSAKDYLYTHVVFGRMWDSADLWAEWWRRAGSGATTEAFCEWLAIYPGFGGFMSYEVACDLHYTPWLAAAPDRDTWAHAGPGAVRGLSWLAHGHPDARVKAPDALAVMRQLLDLANTTAVLGPHLPRPLHLREIEHSLCEVDKYLRVKGGLGRTRRTFAPSAEPLPGADG